MLYINALGASSVAESNALCNALPRQKLAIRELLTFGIKIGFCGRKRGLPPQFLLLHLVGRFQKQV